MAYILGKTIRKFKGSIDNLKLCQAYFHILGIETSCDDTGCAIVNSNGELLAHKLHSQNLIHLRNGGIIPDIAQDLHKKFIEPVVFETLDGSNLSIKDISGIAVTIKPGLPLSLVVGLKYAKYLSKKHNIPIIPIHHMEAHALVAKMYNKICFPYLTLLISGGHCFLALVKSVTDFLLLGKSIDCAPGDVFDKVARQMKLRNLPEYSKVSGGFAIELAASRATDPKRFLLPLPLSEYKDCNFSFNGLKTAALLHLFRKEREHQIVANELIPEVNDLCAALLMTVSKHLVHRVQRAFEFCHDSSLIPEKHKQLVVSGGVACNDYIFNSLKLLCEEYDYKIFRPPKNLCTDNGVMIAWNGLEKWRNQIDVFQDVDSLDIKGSCELGIDITSQVAGANIRVKLFKAG